MYSMPLLQALLLRDASVRELFFVYSLLEQNFSHLSQAYYFFVYDTSCGAQTSDFIHEANALATAHRCLGASSSSVSQNSPTLSNLLSSSDRPQSAGQLNTPHMSPISSEESNGVPELSPQRPEENAAASVPENVQG